MVGRPGKYQPRFTSGELDPLLWANTDEKAYTTGASQFLNVRPIAQGGFANRWGLASRDRLRNVLAAVPTGAATLVPAAGGSTAGLLTPGSPTLFTTNPITTSNAVILTVVFPSPVTISAVDLNGFGASASGAALPTLSQPSAPTGVAGVLQVLAWAGVNFAPLGSPVAITDTLRSRRFTPGGPGATVTTTMVRLVVASLTPSAALFSLQGIAFWAETATLSAARVRSFTHSAAVTYDFVLTDQNIEVYSETGRVASIISPYQSADVAAVKTVQQIDTMLGFLQSRPPMRFFRQGSDIEWNTDVAPFRNTPNYDFGAEYTNGVAAQWEIQFFNFDTALSTSIPIPSGGASYTISVNGVSSPATQQPAGNYTGTAATLQALISAIPGVSPGVTVTQNPSIPQRFLITFAGAGNEGDGWAVSGQAIDKSDAAITAAHYTVGVLGGEPIMSASRGYPGCGCFYGGRLVIGGFQGVPNAWLASESGDYYNIDTRLTASSAPFLVPMDTDGAATIIDLHKGRTLYMFTDAGEYWLSGATLDRTTTPTIVLATTHGIAPTVPPVESEGASIFTAASGGTMFSFVFDYSQQNYQAENISVMSSSLVTGVIDNAIRRLTASTDVNELYAVRGDGQGFMINLLRQQDITSFARIQTDGSLLAVNVNGAFEVSFATERQVNGAPARFLERMVEGQLLDAAETHALASDGVSVGGLGNFVGATVWAIADDFVQGPFAVGSSASLTLGFPATPGGLVTVGRWTPPVVATLPQPRDVAPRTVVRRPARVHTIRLQVVNTTSVAVSANGGPVYDIPINTLASPTDVAPLNAPYTGELVAEGLPGFSMDAIVTITQARPGLLTVTGVTVEVDL